MAEVQFRDKRIAYESYGSGPCLVLLHGYLETKAVWSSFIKLFDNLKIIVPDLPGHGDSDVICDKHTMELMAESVAAILEAEKIEKCVIYGHSMGGYVALAFARLFPEKTIATGLLHSTIYADAADKQHNRKREIEMIEAGKQKLVISGMMPRIVAPQNVEKLQTELQTIMEEALKFSSEGIIAALRGMMERPEHSIDKSKPFHLIGGRFDQFIPVEVYEKMATDNKTIEINFIKETGHASFIEKPEETAAVMKKFLHSACNFFVLG